MANYSFQEFDRLAIDNIEKISSFVYYLTDSSKEADWRKIYNTIGDPANNKEYVRSLFEKEADLSKYISLLKSLSSFSYNLTGPDRSIFREYIKYLDNFLSKKVQERQKREKERKIKDAYNELDEIDAQTRGEKKAIKELKKIQKKQNNKILKTAEIARQEKDEINNYINTYIDQFYKASLRFKNNNQKVGNFFTSNYKNLKSDFTREVMSSSGYKQVNAFYGDYVRKFNIDNLAGDAIRCLTKNIAFSEIKEVFEQKQKEINDFIKNTDQLITESLNIADKALGITEEGFDFASKYIVNYSNSKKTLRMAPIRTINDVRVNRKRNQFLNAIVPIIVTAATKTIDVIVNNVCDEDEVGTFSFDDIPELKEELRRQFGLDSDTLDDFIGLLADLSSFLTKIEICSLFEGAAEEQVVESVIFYIEAFYPNIALYLNTEEKVKNLFVYLGNILPEREELCADVAVASLGDDPCLDPDSYAGKLRPCVFQRDKNKLKSLRKDYIKNKKEGLARAIEIAYFPKEMRANQQEIQKLLEREEQRRKERNLLSIVDGYETYYRDGIDSYKKYYNFNFNYNEDAEPFLNSIFRQLTGSDDAAQEDINRIKNSLIKSYEKGISKISKQINPQLEKNILLSEGEIGIGLSSDGQYEYAVLKKYGNFAESSRALLYYVDVFKAVDKGADPKRYFYNPDLKVPYYGKEYAYSYTPFEKKRRNRSRFTEISSLIAINDKNKPYSPIPFGFKNEVMLEQKKDDIKEGNSFTNYLYNSLGIDYGKVGRDDPNSLRDEKYKRELHTTYNQLAKICYNSVYSRKVPVAASNNSFDSSKISSYDVIPPYYPADDGSFCGRLFSSPSGSLKYKELVNFKEEARIVAGVDIFDYYKPAANEIIDEELERERYLDLLLKFKLQVASFVLKSIHVFSQFNFEEVDVDDMMKDFIYIQMFRNLIFKDALGSQKSFDYLRLTQPEKQEFLKKIRYFDFAPEFVDKIEKEIDDIKQKISGQAFIDQEKARKQLGEAITQNNYLYKIAEKEGYFDNPFEEFKISDKSKVFRYRNPDPRAVGTIAIISPRYNGTIADANYSFRKKYPSLRGETPNKPAIIRLFELINQSFENAKSSLSNLNLKERERQNLFQQEDFLNALAERFKQLDVSKISISGTNNGEKLIVNDAYDITKVLLHHHNKVEKLTQETNFCIAIRNLIAVEISRISKRLKEIIYPEEIKDRSVFSIDERFLEEKLNFIKLDYNNRESYELMLKRGLTEFLKEAVSYQFPYFENLDTAEKYVKEELKRNIDSQLGRNYFLVTTISYSQKTAGKFKVSVRKAFPFEETTFNQSGFKDVDGFRFVVPLDINKDSDNQPYNAHDLEENLLIEDVFGKNSYFKLKRKTFDKGSNKKFEDVFYTFSEYPNSSVGGFFEKWKNLEGTDVSFFGSFFRSRSYKQSFELGESNNPTTNYEYQPPIVLKANYPKDKKESEEQLEQFLAKKADKSLEYVAKLNNISNSRSFIIEKKPIYQKEYDSDILQNGTLRRNYEKKYGKVRNNLNIEDYFHYCVKEEFLKDIKKDIFTNQYGYVFEEALPIRKYLSHIAVNLNLHTDHINNVIKDLNSDVFSLNYVDPLQRANNIIDLKVGQINYLTDRDIQYIKSVNWDQVGVEVGKQLFDFALFTLKSKIKSFMNDVEMKEQHVAFGAKTARDLGLVVRKYFQAANQIESGVRKVGSLFGADIPDRVPTQQQLISKNKAFKYLFNPPVAPFAITNAALGPPPLNVVDFVLYIIFESILIGLDLTQEQVEKLKNQLFDIPEGQISFLKAPEENFQKACKDLLGKYLLKNPRVSDGVTKGGEYITPDGKNYRGEYHIHKDGTVMVGKDHKEVEENIVLTKVVKRDDIEDA